MAYQSGGVIEAVDFNKIAWGTDAGGTYTTALNNLAYIHGVGFGRYGYGQSTTGYTQAAAGNQVTATQWSSLVGGVNGALGLQGASLITPGAVTAGQTITYYNTISTGIDTAWTNAGVGQVGSIAAGTAQAQQGIANWGSSTERRARYTFTVSWVNANLARYWWNCGGKLDITSAVAAGGVTRNTDWSNLCAAMGAIRIGYNDTIKVGGSGTNTILLNTPGFGGYWLNTTIGAPHPGTSQIHYQQYSANAPYTVDYINVLVEFTGVVINGGYSAMTITVDLENDYPSVFQQPVPNAATVTITPRNPVATALGTAPTAPTITSTFSNQ